MDTVAIPDVIMERRAKIRDQVVVFRGLYLGTLYHSEAGLTQVGTERLNGSEEYIKS